MNFKVGQGGIQPPNQVGRSSSCQNLKVRQVEFPSIPQDIGKIHGGKFKTTDDLTERPVQLTRSPGQHPPPIPTDVSQCDAENVKNQPLEQKRTLVDNALQNDTLFEQMIRMYTEQNPPPSWELCKDIPDLQILSLAYCESQGLALPMKLRTNLVINNYFPLKVMVIVANLTSGMHLVNLTAQMKLIPQMNLYPHLCLHLHLHKISMHFQEKDRLIGSRY
jgi:hypothetical protein